MVSITLAVQINKTFIPTESNGWVIFHQDCGIVHKEHTLLPLTDLQEHQGSGQESWRSVQDPEVPARPRTDHPDNHAQSYPPGNEVRERLIIIIILQYNS